MDEKVEIQEPSSGSDTPPETQVAPSTYIKPQARGLHDPNITFEEYHYYARKTREEEKDLKAPMLNWREFMMRKKNQQNAIGEESNAERDPAKYHTEVNFANRDNRIEISDEEWTNASRAFRTASWGACKYCKIPTVMLRYKLMEKVSTLSLPTFSGHTALASPWVPWGGDQALLFTLYSASWPATVDT